uniref:Uncharacterized protein n=1 Tax=Anguilla anguilla TaxID=7936 RepID=A0A0E9WEK3_ANGAN
MDYTVQIILLMMYSFLLNSCIVVYAYGGNNNMKTNVA